MSQQRISISYSNNFHFLAQSIRLGLSQNGIQDIKSVPANSIPCDFIIATLAKKSLVYVLTQGCNSKLPTHASLDVMVRLIGSNGQFSFILVDKNYGQDPSLMAKLSLLCSLKDVTLLNLDLNSTQQSIIEHFLLISAFDKPKTRGSINDPSSSDRLVQTCQKLLPGATRNDAETVMKKCNTINKLLMMDAMEMKNDLADENIVENMTQFLDKPI